MSEAECRKPLKRHRTNLTQDRMEMPEIPQRRERKRGWILKSDAHNLHERLLKYEDSVLRFMSDPNVKSTNNAGKPKIRMSKVKMKVSGCFRAERHATHTPGTRHRVFSTPWENSDTIHASPSRSRLPEMPLTWLSIIIEPREGAAVIPKRSSNAFPHIRFQLSNAPEFHASEFFLHIANEHVVRRLHYYPSLNDKLAHCRIFASWQKTRR